MTDSIIKVQPLWSFYFVRFGGGGGKYSWCVLRGWIKVLCTFVVHLLNIQIFVIEISEEHSLLGEEQLMLEGDKLLHSTILTLGAVVLYLLCVCYHASCYMYVPGLAAHNRSFQDSEQDNHKQWQTNLRCTWLDFCKSSCTVDYTVLLGVPVLSGPILKFRTNEAITPYIGTRSLWVSRDIMHLWISLKTLYSKVISGDVADHFSLLCFLIDRLLMKTRALWSKYPACIICTDLVLE